MYFYGRVEFIVDEWGLWGWFMDEWFLGCRFLILLFLLNFIFSGIILLKFIEYLFIMGINIYFINENDY